MTTEPPATPEPTPDPGTSSAPTSSAVSLGNMSGERLIMIAGLVVVGVYVIFGLIADEWFPPFASIVVATFAVLIPTTKLKSVGSVSAASLMTLIGYWLAVAGAWDFIDDLRFGWGGSADVIASLLLAAGAVIAFLGARAIKH